MVIGFVCYGGVGYKNKRKYLSCLFGLLEGL